MQITAAFKAFDADNSGKLDAKELRKALKLYGITTTPLVTRKILKTYDAKPDGGLDINEFGTLVTDLERSHKQGVFLITFLFVGTAIAFYLGLLEMSNMNLFSSAPPLPPPKKHPNPIFAFFDSIFKKR